jgi:hypothetical protein
MDPVGDGLIPAAEGRGAGGGVERAGGDQGEGLRPCAGAPMGRLKCGAAEVVEGLAPLEGVDAGHGDASG